MNHRASLRIAHLIGLVAILGMNPFPSRAEEPPVPVAALAWPAGPLEVRIAFDKAPDEATLAGLVGQAITFPGFDPYRDDPASASASLRIAGVRAIDDRTLVLATDPHPAATAYTLKGLPAPGRSLSYDLHGVEVAWFEGDRDDEADPAGEPSWSGWWPGLEPRAARAATAVSIDHARAFERIAAGPGQLTLRALVGLPEEAASATVRLEGDRPFEATLGFETAQSERAEDGSHHAEVTTEVFPGQPVELNVTILVDADGSGVPPALRGWRVDGEEVRELDREALFVPWAPAAPPESSAVPPPPFELSGGDPERGRAVFASEVAKCASCHQIAGQGGQVGPALDKLAGADPARIYHDLADPSARIAPEYLTYTVAMADGRVAVGVVRAEGSETIRVLDTDAKATVVEREQVEDLLPSGTSVMPVGLVGALGEDRVRDLIAYLRSGAGRTDEDH